MAVHWAFCGLGESVHPTGCKGCRLVAAIPLGSLSGPLIPGPHCQTTGVAS
jgi:hypothetical protein